MYVHVWPSLTIDPHPSAGACVWQYIAGSGGVPCVCVAEARAGWCARLWGAMHHAWSDSSQFTWVGMVLWWLNRCSQTNNGTVGTSASLVIGIRSLAASQEVQWQSEHSRV